MGCKVSERRVSSGGRLNADIFIRRWYRQLGCLSRQPISARHSFLKARIAVVPTYKHTELYAKSGCGSIQYFLTSSRLHRERSYASPFGPPARHPAVGPRLKCTNASMPDIRVQVMRIHSSLAR